MIAYSEINVSDFRGFGGLGSKKASKKGERGGEGVTCESSVLAREIS